jgi:pimeloyl-ACP methyl ester carboxylesterase
LAGDLTRLARDELSALPRGIGDVHAAIADRVFGLLGPPAAPVRRFHDTISRGVYETVAGGVWLGAHAAGVAAEARAARRGTAGAAAAPASRHGMPPARAAGAPQAGRAGTAGVSAHGHGASSPSESPRRAAALAALNAVIGDRLAAEGSPLAIPMQVRRVGAVATPHLVVFVHGLGETEYAWGSPGYAEALDDVTPVFVRYNSGRHISENGAALDELLTAMVADRDVARITLIGHSMGGLVARSAAHRGSAWTRLVRHVITLGTPHDGAPLEQAVHVLSAALHLAPETRPFARFLRRRSAGIRDLRRGSLVDADWHDLDPDALRARARTEVALLDGATHCFVSATITRDARHPLGRLLGDMLVLSPSASGRRVGFTTGLAVGGAHHLALLNHPAVAEQLRTWLAPT